MADQVEQKYRQNILFKIIHDDILPLYKIRL